MGRFDSLTELSKRPTPPVIDRDASLVSSQKHADPVPLVPPVRVVLPVRPVPPSPAKRVMKQRHPFDIYQDQYEALQSVALEERKQGGVGSMSALVREAIDKILAEKRS